MATAPKRVGRWNLTTAPLRRGLIQAAKRGKTLGLALLPLGFAALTLPAAAEEKIGSAATIEKEVKGSARGERKLKVGDEIFFDEVLSTGAASRGKFTFDDRTALQMGPSSTVKLDSFVYSGGSGLGFNAAKGAFRFVSAPGEHKGYDIRTPTAIIGVRGTAFAVRVFQGGTDAVLYNGSIEVCNAAGENCQTVNNPCDRVRAAADGSVSEPRKVGKKDWSFSKECKGAPPAGGGSGQQQGNQQQGNQQQGNQQQNAGQQGRSDAAMAGPGVGGGGGGLSLPLTTLLQRPGGGSSSPN